MQSTFCSLSTSNRSVTNKSSGSLVCGRPIKRMHVFQEINLLHIPSLFKDSSAERKSLQDIPNIVAPSSSNRPLWKDPIFLTVAGCACIAGWFYPPSAIFVLPAKVLAVTQVVSSIALVACLSGLSASSMRTKLMRTSFGAGLFSLQFATLGLAGVSVAWGGALAMGIACIRSLVFSAMQAQSQRARNIIAGLFIATGTTLAVFGIGNIPPLVPLDKITSGDAMAIATMLPMFASMLGTIGNSMPRMRYARPLMTVAGVVNCIYNGFFSGSLGHLINEIAGIVVHARQFFARDFPSNRLNGEKLSLQERWTIYRHYMLHPRLSEEYLQSGK